MTENAGDRYRDSSNAVDAAGALFGRWPKWSQKLIAEWLQKTWLPSGILLVVLLAPYVLPLAVVPPYIDVSPKQADKLLGGITLKRPTGFRAFIGSDYGVQPAPINRPGPLGTAWVYTGYWLLAAFALGRLAGITNDAANATSVKQAGIAGESSASVTSNLSWMQPTSLISTGCRPWTGHP